MGPLKLGTDMKNPEIINYSQLVAQINCLKEDRLKQEEELNYTFKEFISSLNPIYRIKDSLHNLATDSEVHTDLVKMGLNFVVNFIADSFFGKRRGIKNAFGAALIENISSILINNNASKIVSIVSDLIHPKPVETEEKEE